MAVKPNELIAGYYFAQQVGETASTTLWLAHDSNTSQHVVIKLLRADRLPPSTVQSFYERLVGAVTDVGRLTHQGLAPVRSTFHDPRRELYGLVSEYIQGLTLEAIQIPHSIDGRPGASDARTLAGVLSWFQQLGAVLAWLHTNGVVHGALKPSNVMLMTGIERPQIKLLDLCWSNARLELPELDTTYWPPEQEPSAPPTPAGDQFAAAKILHNLLVTSAEEVTAPQALAAAPVALLKTVQKAMSRDPAQRFTDMGAFFYAIESVKNSLEAATAREQGGGRRPPVAWEERKRVSSTAQLSPVKAPAPMPKEEVGALTAPTEPVRMQRAKVEPRVVAPSREDDTPDPRAMMKIEEGEPPPNTDFSGPNSQFAAIESRSMRDRRDVPAPPPRPPPPSGGQRPAGFHRPLAPLIGEPAETGTTGEFEVPDDDEDAPPKKSWALILGAVALATALVIFGAALWIHFSAGEITVRDPNAARDAAVAEVVAPAGGVTAPDAAPVEVAVAPPAVLAHPDASAPAVVAAHPDASVAPVVAPAVAPVVEPVVAAEADVIAAREAACTKADPSACLELGERFLTGRGVEASVARAAAAYERACYLNRLDGCMKAGELYEKSAATARKSRTMYERACDRRIAQGCVLLSRLYREGIGGAPNARNAEAFKRRACGLGNKESCR